MIALIDTNVFLDLRLKREPFFQDSASVIAASEEEAFDGYCCATSLTDIFYIVRKEHDQKAALDFVADILRSCRVAPVNKTTIAGALTSGFREFEDGVLCESAREINASCIITRNVGDFAKSAVPAILPGDFLELLKKESE